MAETCGDVVPNGVVDVRKLGVVLRIKAMAGGFNINR